MFAQTRNRDIKFEEFLFSKKIVGNCDLFSFGGSLIKTCRLLNLIFNIEYFYKKISSLFFQER